jgi:hypothetical protein
MARGPLSLSVWAVMLLAIAAAAAREAIEDGKLSPAGYRR